MKVDSKSHNGLAPVPPVPNGPNWPPSWLVTPPYATTPPGDLPISAWDLNAEQFERWEERVCIMHFDGGMPWPTAEAHALAEVNGGTKEPSKLLDS